MLWLVNHERWGQVGEFDPEKGRILSIRDHDELQSLSPRDSDGWYYDVKDGVFALYKLNGALQLHLRGRAFQLEDDTTVEVSRPKDLFPLPRRRRRLRVVKQGRAVFETTYRPRGLGMIPGDPTPFVEEDHFDFGLWVTNVSKDPKRKAVCMEVWGAEKKNDARGN